MFAERLERVHEGLAVTDLTASPARAKICKTDLVTLQEALGRLAITQLTE